MSKGYTADGKRISASTHARRSWTCSCGKVVSGNGGRSSHQRACLVYLREMLAFHERMLAELIAGEQRGPASLIDRHGHEVDVLRERIAARVATEERQRQRGAHVRLAAQVARRTGLPPSTKAMPLFRHADHADRSPWEYGVCDECWAAARALSGFDLSCALSEIRRRRSTFEEPVTEALLDEAARRLGGNGDPAALDHHMTTTLVAPQPGDGPCHAVAVDVAGLAAAVRRSLSNGESVGDTLRLVRQLVMDLEAAEDPSPMLVDEPPTTGDARWDALIAGVVEDFALHHDVPAPSWVFDPSRYLERWWFVTSFASMRPTAIVETPAALSGRGVFIQRASLVNV